MKKIKWMGLIITSLLVGFLLSYLSFRKNPQVIQDVEISHVSAQNERTVEDTNFIFKTIYEHSDLVEIQEETCPTHLIDKNLHEIKLLFPTWRVDHFSSKEVMLVQVVADAFDFILGTYDEFVAVYANVDGEKELKEITNISIFSLPEEEIKNLRKGIPIKNEEALYRIMEDYDS